MMYNHGKKILAEIHEKDTYTAYPKTLAAIALIALVLSAIQF